MNTVKTPFDTPTSDFHARQNMKAGIAYIKVLLEELAQFETFSGSANDLRHCFMKLMTLTLGSTTDWSRAEIISRKLGISLGAIRRYASRVSAPHECLYPVITSCLKEVLVDECSQIEIALASLEVEHAERCAEQEKTWQELLNRVSNPLPNTPLNCRVHYSPNNSLSDQTRLLFAYPCRGAYPISSFFIPICDECNAHGKEFAHTHGRVFLESEDGLLLLPQIVRTQIDLLQVIDDLFASTKNNSSLILEGVSWIEDCRLFLLSHEIIGNLPPGEPDSAKPRDLTKDNLGWVM